MTLSPNLWKMKMRKKKKEEEEKTGRRSRIRSRRRRSRSRRHRRKKRIRRRVRIKVTLLRNIDIKSFIVKSAFTRMPRNHIRVSNVMTMDLCFLNILKH